MYRDPFKVGENDVIVVCDTHTPDGDPTESNKRYLMQEAVDRTKEHEPWFGIEQEYTLLDIDERPFGWPENGMRLAYNLDISMRIARSNTQLFWMFIIL